MLPKEEDQRVPAAEVGHLLGSLSAAVGNADDMAVLEASAGSYAFAWRYHFSSGHDPSRIHGEANVFRYRPVEVVVLRAGDGTKAVEGAQAALAARTCGARLEISVRKHGEVSDALAGELGIQVRVETGEEFVRRLDGFDGGSGRPALPGFVRLLGEVEDGVFEVMGRKGMNWIDQPVLALGRLELRCYVREQAVSETRHRYGNVV